MDSRWILGAWDIKDGKIADEVEISVFASDEITANVKATEIVTREYYELVSVEEMPEMVGLGTKETSIILTGDEDSPDSKG